MATARSRWLIEYGQKGAGWQRPTSASSSSSGTSITSSAGQRKFYRALSPTERLPEGLPEWFPRKDKDGDGQVSMAEFSDSWTNEKAAEFSKYDVNNDGYITPAECFEAGKR